MASSKNRGTVCPYYNSCSLCPFILMAPEQSVNFTFSITTYCFMQTGDLEILSLLNFSKLWIRTKQKLNFLVLKTKQVYGLMTIPSNDTFFREVRIFA